MTNMMQNVAALPKTFFKPFTPGTRFSVKLVRYMLSSGMTYWTMYDIWLIKTKIIIMLCTTKTIWLTKTHLHLVDVAECRLVFNHFRKTLKIGAGWIHFCETLSLTADMKIVFEFIGPNVNCVLYWPCL
ncbi:hypothetical protein AAZX31_06G063100 [Glycine max]|nr:hypothetical protein GYH30_014276 [Glycine max]